MKTKDETRKPGRIRKTDPFAPERRTYLSAGRPRLTNDQIIAAAKRFEAEGELDNAHNMMELLK